MRAAPSMALTSTSASCRPGGSVFVVVSCAALLGVAALIGVGAGASPARLAVLLLIAPLAEEAVFRAGLQEAMLQRGASGLMANLLCALAFAVSHAAVRDDPAALAVALPALLIGAVYQRWRRLRPCVLLHAALNAAWIAGAARYL